MSDHELLQELVRHQRRAERNDQIKTAVIASLLLILIVLALIYIPRITAPIRQIDESLRQIEGSLSASEEFFSSFNADTAAKLEQALDGLSESSEQIREFMSTLKDSGLDGLKGTIDDLNKVLKGVLQLFGRG